MKRPTTAWVLSFVTIAILLSVIVACAQTTPPSSTEGAKPGTAAKTEPAAKVESAAKTEPAAKSESAAKTEPAPPPKELQKIKVQIPVKTADYLPLYIGKEKGLFKAEGLDPDILVIKGDLAVPALLKGELDYLNVINRTLQAGVQGEPVRVVLGQQTKAGWHFFFGPNVTSPQQLKGKPVGITMKGGTDNQAAVAAVKHLGLDPDKDVTFMVVPSYGDVLTALKSGAISAGVLLPPENQMAARAGMKDAVFVGDILELPYGGLGTTVKKIQENPAQVKAVIRTYLKGMAYVRDHPDEASAYLVSEFKVDKDAADAMVADEVKVWAFNGAISDQGLANQMESWKAAGGPLKDATLDQVKKAIDFSLLGDVQKELGLAK